MMAAAASRSAASDGLGGWGPSAAGVRLLAPALAGHCAAATMLLVAVIVVGRRLAGGLTTPLSLPAVVAVAAVGSGLAVIAERTGRRPAATGSKLTGWLTRGCLLATLGAVGLFGSNGLMATATGLLMLAVAAAPAFSGSWPPPLPAALPRLSGWRLTRRGPAATAPRSPAVLSPAAAPPPRGLHGQRLQWQERYRLADGRELLRGQLVVTLSAASRLATGHVGFCPAFPAIPDVTVATDYDALEVAVDAAEVLPWGIRVECRVEDPADEPVAIPIDIEVSLRPPPSPSFSSPPLQAD